MTESLNIKLMAVLEIILLAGKKTQTFVNNSIKSDD